MVAINYSPTLAAPPAGPSPEAIALQQAYAKQLLAGSDQPIHSWSQGVAGIVDALVGGTMARKAGERQAAGEQGAASQFADLLTGGSMGGGAATPPAAEAPPSSDMFSQGLDAATPGVGAAPSPPTSAPGAPDPARIRAILANPWASPEQKAMAIELWKAQMPKAPEAYTLKPGEHRFVGGRDVASVPEEPKPSTDYGDYIKAKAEGYQGSLETWKKEMAKAGSTTVTTNVGPTGIDYGKPPDGYAWVRDAQGNVVPDADGLPTAKPYKGGPVDAANQATAIKTADAAKQSGVYADVVTTDVDRALDAITKNPGQTTGVGGALLSWIPGSHAYDASKLIDTIKANVGFDRLQQMRQASTTGGALGAVSDFENQLLQATIGNLAVAQSPDQLKYNLQRVKDIYSAIITRGIKPGDPLASGTPAAAPAAPTSAPAAAPSAPSRQDIENEMRRRGLLGGGPPPAPVAAAAPADLPYRKDASTGSGIRTFSMPYGSLGG